MLNRRAIAAIIMSLALCLGAANAAAFAGSDAAKSEDYVSGENTQKNWKMPKILDSPMVFNAVLGTVTLFLVSITMSKSRRRAVRRREISSTERFRARKKRFLKISDPNDDE